MTAEGTYVRRGTRDLHRELVERITTAHDPTRVDEDGYHEVG